MRKALLTTVLLLSTASAEAYTIREVSPGNPVRWHAARASIVIDRETITQVGEGDEGIEAVVNAYQAWNGVEGAYVPDFEFSEGTVDAIGYQNGGENQNTVRFAPNGEEIAGDALGVTVLTFDSSGKILDADIVMNGGQARQFKIVSAQEAQAAEDYRAGKGGEMPAHYDFQNVLAHEVGHSIGFGEEEALEDATMFYNSGKGDINKRDLAGDDALGAQKLYAELLSSDEAATSSSSGSCAVRQVSGFGSDTYWWAAAGLALGVAGLAVTSQRNRRFLLASSASLAMAGAIAPPMNLDRGQQALRQPDALVRIVEVKADWVGGILVTDVRGEVESCSLDTCPESKEVHMQVLGGTDGDIYQIVGHGQIPKAGTAMSAVVRDGQWVLPRVLEATSARLDALNKTH